MTKKIFFHRNFALQSFRWITEFWLYSSSSSSSPIPSIFFFFLVPPRRLFNFFFPTLGLRSNGKFLLPLIRNNAKAYEIWTIYFPLTRLFNLQAWKAKFTYYFPLSYPYTERIRNVSTRDIKISSVITNASYCRVLNIARNYCYDADVIYTSRGYYFTILSSQTYFSKFAL